MNNRIELNELETFLYASADILRGYVEASDYKSYVCTSWKEACTTMSTATAVTAPRALCAFRKRYGPMTMYGTVWQQVLRSWTASKKRTKRLND